MKTDLDNKFRLHSHMFVGIIDVIVIIAMVVFVSVYSSNRNLLDEERNREYVQELTASASEKTEIYIDYLEEELENRRKYIRSLAKIPTLEAAAEYLAYSNMKSSENFFLVNCRTLVGLAVDSSGNSYPLDFNKRWIDSYQSIIDSCKLYSVGSVNKEKIWLTSGFSNPVNGVPSIAVYTEIDLLEEGDLTPFEILHVIPKAAFEGFQTISMLAESSVALVDDNGDYIIKTNDFKGSNIYEFIVSHNNLEKEKIPDLKQSVKLSRDGLFEYNNSKGEDCFFSHNEVNLSANWQYFSMVPKTSIISSDTSNPFFIVLSLFIILMVLLNGVLVFLSNRKLRHLLNVSNKAISEANIANKAKGDFLSNMSHEIRTPLNSIIGYSAMMRNEIGVARNTGDYLSLMDKIDEFNEKTNSASKHLLSIINDILDVSIIEQGKMKIVDGEFDFKAFIASISTMFRTLSSFKGVKFEIVFTNQISDWLIGDQLRLNQILINLLNNAVKFTPENGEVKLIISQQELEDDNVILTFLVSDTGIGMDQEFLKKLFKPFEQAEGTVLKKVGGTGLGLSITKSLVDLMHGEITVSSELNKGSIFTVKLNFKTATSRSKNELAYNFANQYALVVDDDKDACESLKLLLDNFHVRNKEVFSGEEALKLLHQAKKTGDEFTLCLMDWKMPEIDGMQTLRKIRSEFSATLPVVIITGFDYSKIEEEAKQAGANIIVTKPLFSSSMMDLLVNLCAKPENIVLEDDRKAFAGRHLLLAEDNEMNMEIAKVLLQSKGFEVIAVSNGKQAVDTFLSAAPSSIDAILMDVQMPEMDGYEATKEIRASSHPEAASIPILAMTANAFDTDIAASLAAGMNGHISKPIDIEQLFGTLDKFIK